VNLDLDRSLLSLVLLTLVLLAVLANLLVMLLRRPKAGLGELWLQHQERQARDQQQTVQALARSEGALSHLSQHLTLQLRELNQGSQDVMGEFRESLEARMAQSLAESRLGRQELAQALAGFSRPMCSRT